MTLKYFSQYYGIDTASDEDWFDPRMSLDTLLFIDPFLVFETDNPFFINAKGKFFNFFNTAFELAHEATRSRTSYQKLKRIFNFPEVKELCLGFSEKGTSGSGAGGGYSQGFADALVKLAKGGYKGLDHFEEIEIFTVGIGKDRISDATANIIKIELIEYTQNVCKRFNIPTICHVIKNTGFNFKSKRWDDCCFSLPENPFFPKGERAVILVPKEFLCTSHAISSDGFENYIKGNKNEDLRIDLNYEIEKELKKFSKSMVVDIAERHPTWIREYVNYIETEAEIMPYDLEVDSKNIYRNEKKAYEFILSEPINISASNDHEFIQFIELIVHQFKTFIEAKEGFKLLWDVSNKSTEPQAEYQPRNEFNAQSLFADIILGYSQANGIDIFKESEVGREVINFKFPSGYQNSALIKLKLARNIRFKQEDLTKLLADVRIYGASHNYYLVIPYIEREVERLEKAVEEIKSIDFDNVQFQLVIVNAALEQSIKEQSTTSRSTTTSMQTILFLAANPKNTSHLRLDEECKKIEEALVRSKQRNYFKVISKWATTDDDLRRALLEYEPEIVHFSGHSGINGICLEDEIGQAQDVSGEALANLFELCSEHLKCIVLNACYSEAQATVIEKYIDYVIGMQEAIGDATAIKFSQGFYDALGAGKSFETAYKFGCNAIDLRGIPESLKPVLKKRSQPPTGLSETI